MVQTSGTAVEGALNCSPPVWSTVQPPTGTTRRVVTNLSSKPTGLSREAEAVTTEATGAVVLLEAVEVISPHPCSRAFSPTDKYQRTHLPITAPFLRRAITQSRRLQPWMLRDVDGDAAEDAANVVAEAVLLVVEASQLPKDPKSLVLTAIFST
jgi:hypothetical protein